LFFSRSEVTVESDARAFAKKTNRKDKKVKAINRSGPRPCESAALIVVPAGRNAPLPIRLSCLFF